MRRRDLVILLVVAAVLAGGTCFLALRTARRAVDRKVAEVFKPRETTVDLGTLVTRVRDLNRLETASMRVMQVSTITQSYKLVPNSLGSDEITFLATGDVIAGVDLAQLRRQDVWREPDGTVVMRLPSAQILVSRVDNRESRVMSRKTGVLRRSDINLEARARQNAEQAIRNEAVNKGILNLATQNAQKRLADLLHTLGFAKVRFVEGAAAVG
ncbi:MAG TPA: DUF4230 domain-containing protein [Thermoanaerobaculia bacterium]|jgi:hypothetical protein|nr:DUF4230 domain-containing protein [Thermoanaerobaculia bacterium]